MTPKPEAIPADVLEPCPFCGGEAKIIEGEECAYVQCADVKMHRALWFDGDNNAAGEVAEQWNRRAALEPAPKPAGGEWVTVPREPTESMKERVRGHGGAQALAFAMAAWPDMLAAAPPAPAAIAERDERLSTARMIAEAAEDQRDAAKALASELQREVERKDKALIWYENNVAGCRLIHSGGDSHRAALAEDGGSRARAALQQEGKSDA